jgi:hypothetical protein
METDNEVKLSVFGGEINLGSENDERYTDRLNRFDSLQEALWERGLKIRADSVLSKEYILEGTHELDYVVDSIVRMTFLYQKTRYIKILRRSGLKRSNFETADAYYAAVSPLQAVAAYNWARRFKMDLYMIPSKSLREEVRHQKFGDWMGMIWTPPTQTVSL